MGAGGQAASGFGSQRTRLAARRTNSLTFMTLVEPNNARTCPVTAALQLSGTGLGRAERVRVVIVGPGRRLPVFLLKAEHCGSWQAEGQVCEPGSDSEVPTGSSMRRSRRWRQEPPRCRLCLGDFWQWQTRWRPLAACECVARGSGCVHSSPSRGFKPESPASGSLGGRSPARPPLRRVHPSREWRPLRVGSSSKLRQCLSPLSDQVRCGVPVVQHTVLAGSHE